MIPFSGLKRRRFKVLFNTQQPVALIQGINMLKQFKIRVFSKKWTFCSF